MELRQPRRLRTRMGYRRRGLCRAATKHRINLRVQEARSSLRKAAEFMDTLREKYQLKQIDAESEATHD